MAPPVKRPAGPAFLKIPVVEDFALRLFAAVAEGFVLPFAQRVKAQRLVQRRLVFPSKGTLLAAAGQRRFFQKLRQFRRFALFRQTSGQRFGVCFPFGQPPAPRKGGEILPQRHVTASFGSVS